MDSLSVAQGGLGLGQHCTRSVVSRLGDTEFAYPSAVEYDRGWVSSSAVLLHWSS